MAAHIAASASGWNRLSTNPAGQPSARAKKQARAIGPGALRFKVSYNHMSLGGSARVPGEGSESSGCPWGGVCFSMLFTKKLYALSGELGASEPLHRPSGSARNLTTALSKPWTTPEVPSSINPHGCNLG